MKRSQKKGSKKSKQNYGENEKTLQEIMEEMMEENGDGRTSGNSSLNPKGKVSYSVASAASALRQGQALGANVLIVDPPRKGLEEDVLTQLCKPHNPKQAYTEDPMFLEGPKYSTNWVNDVHTLIYVSCGFDALARDCDRLLKGNAGWRLESATGYVLFPGTNHIETVAVFQRKAGRDSMY
jgi:23S rRNA (uracil1939-C5)-methyltransferase